MGPRAMTSYRRFFEFETVRMYVKRGWATVIACGAWAVAWTAPVNAQDLSQAEGLALAQRKACMACHQIDSKRVGPPLRSVAERYAAADQGGATVQYLADKIRGGGRGAWGAVPMPAQSQVSEDDARLLALWVLSLAPATTK